ncbi:MAG TPA: tetratricopeptide repeat protein [Candidatus Acidoferrales bacterium]|nr:tetratricopeptide repeat protein [Candidatus Acidoferrales bacterium]
MKHWAFFAISLLITTLAQEPARAVSEVAKAPSQQSDSDQDSSSAPKTPLELAEIRAQILMARKDYAEAAVAYQRILDQKPDNAQILNQIGIAYQELHQDELAERFYRRALKADKNSPFILNNLGSIEHGKGRYGRAIKYYKKAIQVGGDAQAAVYYNLGSAYCAIRQFPRAMEAFGKALAIDPHVFEARGGAGAIIQQHSDTDQGTLNYFIAKSYAKAGDAERAARYLKIARDDGYKNFMAAEKDPDFAKVIKDPQVQEVLHRRPAYETQQDTPVTN